MLCLPAPIPLDTTKCIAIRYRTLQPHWAYYFYPSPISKPLSHTRIEEVELFGCQISHANVFISHSQVMCGPTDQAPKRTTHTHIVGSLIYFGKQNWNHGRNLIAIGIPCWFVTAITQSNFLTVKIIIFWLCYDARDARTSAKNTPCPAISYIFDWTIVILGRSTRVECVCVFYRRTIKLTENGMAWQVGKRVAAAAATIIP